MTPGPTNSSARPCLSYLLLALGLLILPACDDPPADPVEHASSRSGGELIVAVQDDATSLDPHAVTDAASMRMIENLYSTLLRYSATYGEVEPDLARRIDISDDGLTVTLTLNTDATFHSGRAVTADDVAYSLRRIAERGVRSHHFAAVEHIETPDRATVVLHLRERVAPLETYLAYPMNAIVDRQVVEAHDGQIDAVDAGSGPFRLLEWRRNQRLVLQKHHDYHVPDRPRLERLTYRPIPDETTRTTALRTGEIHLITDVAPKDVRLLESAPGVEVAATPGTFWEYIGLNTSRPPFDDVRVRQAVAWAIDRSVINQLVKFGQATVLDGGHIPPNHWAHADLHLYPRRDVDKARTLLHEAGYADRLAVTMIVPSAFNYQVQAGEVIKQQLADAGIDVTLQGLESQVFFNALGQGDFTMTVVGWVGFVDPDEWTYNLFHSDGKFNQQQYANPALDELLEAGRATLGREPRHDLYNQAQRIIADQAPMVFLYVNDHTSAWRQNVQGYTVHPTATTLFLRDTWIAR